MQVPPLTGWVRLSKKLRHCEPVLKLSWPLKGFPSVTIPGISNILVPKPVISTFIRGIPTPVLRHWFGMTRVLGTFLTRCPTPHGVGGLKSRGEYVIHRGRGSHPSRGGWIEILMMSLVKAPTSGPTPHGDVIDLRVPFESAKNGCKNW